MSSTTCCFCGSGKEIEWHHVVWSPVQVIIPLCRACHQSVHKNAKPPRRPGKSIQLTVDNDVYEKLKELKGDRTWEEFLVEAGLKYVKAEEEG